MWCTDHRGGDLSRARVVQYLISRHFSSSGDFPDEYDTLTLTVARSFDSVARSGLPISRRSTPKTTSSPLPSRCGRRSPSVLAGRRQGPPSEQTRRRVSLTQENRPSATTTAHYFPNDETPMMTSRPPAGLDRPALLRERGSARNRGVAYLQRETVDPSCVVATALVDGLPLSELKPLPVFRRLPR